MQTIRSFIAVPLVPDVAKVAGKLIDRLSPECSSIRWVPKESLHLTLKFLGDVENTEVPRICDCIRKAVDGVEPFQIDFIGASAMPSIERPRVVHMGVEDDLQGLSRIAGRLENLLADLGYKREARDYRPHLTLGRVKGSRTKASASIIDAIEQEKELDAGTMVVDQVQLVASFLDREGPTYQVMDTVDLG
ncbi:MAG: RNA 2',3'-cyclic phosphodiesterase [Planctomycetota bacterium]